MTVVGYHVIFPSASVTPKKIYIHRAIVSFIVFKRQLGPWNVSLVHIQLADKTVKRNLDIKKRLAVDAMKKIWFKKQNGERAGSSGRESKLGLEKNKDQTVSGRGRESKLGLEKKRRAGEAFKSKLG